MDQRLLYEILRLVSKLIASAGLQFLTVKKHFSFRERSLERLQQIARRPVMCRNLKGIAFMVDVVPNFQSSSLWESQAGATCLGSPSAKDIIAEDWLKKHDMSAVVPIQDLDQRFRELGWRYQLKIRAEQQALLIILQNTTKTISHSLAKLTDLKTFRLDTFGPRHHQAMRPLFIVEAQQSWYCYNSTCSVESFNTVCLHVFNALLTSLSASYGLNAIALP